MCKEEVLFEGPDTGWQNKIFPVTLITYEDMTMDIHRQTGRQFDEHIAEAEKILSSRGLQIDPNDKWIYGGSGAYRRVVK